VLPFLELLGYDTKNPAEICPEFAAGFAAPQDNKRVDFAVLKEGEPVILVESKWCGKPLTLDNSAVQLYQYFNATNAHFAILTNGLIYQFFTDNKKSNIMDDNSFFEVDLSNLDVRAADVLEVFRKDKFDCGLAKRKTSEYIMERQIRGYITRQLKSLDDDVLVRHILRQTDFYNSHKDDVKNYRKLVKTIVDDCAREFVDSRQADTPVLEHEAEQTKKDKVIQNALSAIREFFAGQIRGEKLRFWETQKDTTIACCGIIVCKLRFLRDGSLKNIRFVSSDDTYPRKLKYDVEISGDIDFKQFKNEFSEQINQVKRWVKTAEI
jgi:hypothetical protein